MNRYHRDPPKTEEDKAVYIRNKLIRWIGITGEKAESIHFVMRINEKDVRYECDWLKELLK